MFWPWFGHHQATIEHTRYDVTKWDPIQRALVIPCMFYSGLMMAEPWLKRVALM
jgi:hypothetical protein